MIIRLLRSVGNLVFYLHTVCTVCTCLHSVCRPYYTRQYPFARLVIPLTFFGIGGANFGLERLKELPPVTVKPASRERYVMLLWQQNGASVGKCR